MIWLASLGSCCDAKYVEYFPTYYFFNVQDMVALGSVMHQLVISPLCGSNQTIRLWHVSQC